MVDSKVAPIVFTKLACTTRSRQTIIGHNRSFHSNVLFCVLNVTLEELYISLNDFSHFIPRCSIVFTWS